MGGKKDLVKEDSRIKLLGSKRRVKSGGVNRRSLFLYSFLHDF